MLDLSSTIELDFRKFLRWWGHELSFLVPKKIRQIISDKQGYVIVKPEGAQLSLAYVNEGEPEPLICLDRDDAGIQKCKALWASDERLAKANVIMRLTNHEAIEKELTFPLAAKENLNQVVSYELDRYTPFRSEQVYFAVKTVPKSQSNEPDQVRANLILTPREILDSLYEDIHAMGLVPLFVDYEGDPNSFEYSEGNYNLLPERLRPKTAKAPKIIHSLLIASVVLLLLAVIVMPVWFEYQTVHVLQDKIHKIEKEAKKIKEMQLEIDALLDETAKLIKVKAERPPVLEMLNTLSELIKDDTSLAYLQYSEGVMQIQGESPAASPLIGVLESSDLFTNARFVSPVTQDTVSKLERFQITVELKKTGDNVGTSQQ